MKPTKVCIVSLYSYPVFNPKSNLVFGGSEVRAALFGKEIAKNPQFEVSFVVLNHDNRYAERFDNITIWRHTGYRTFLTPLGRFKAEVKKVLKRKAHFPYLRRGPFKIKSLGNLIALMFSGLTYSLQRSLAWRPMKGITIDGEKVAQDKVAIYRTIDADIYCVFGVSEVSAELMKFCEAYGKKAVLLCGSDYDFSPIYQLGSKERNLYNSRGSICYHALAGAHQIVTQTEFQSNLLRERFGRDSAIIRNPIHLSATIPSLGRRRFALWIGKSDDIKQPELALELARRVPNVKIVMVLNRCLEEKFHQILADRPPNVTIIERVPIDKVERLFARAFAFVSTSRFEGFPNTFLQAGKYAVPILSLNVDPDGFIEKNGCGIVAHGNMDHLVDGLRRLAADLPERERFGACIRSYVEQHHDVGKNVLKLIQVLNACVHEGVPNQTHRSPRSDQHSHSFERAETCVE